jgi:uncharacterized protein (DUF4213/DUF364 family)
VCEEPNWGRIRPSQEEDGLKRTCAVERAPLVDMLFEAFEVPAAAAQIATTTIGLGYTAVETTAGDLGLSYTMVGGSACSALQRAYRDFDGAQALDLLQCVRSDDTLERSLGIALVNALNQRRASAMLQDAAPGGAFMRDLDIRPGVRVAMVGYFPPVVARLETAGAEVDVLDRDLEMGNETRFLRRIEVWPDVLVVTATTILNGSFELFMDHVGPGVRVIVLGPTTPMVPEAYEAFPIDMLGGMVAVDNDRVVSAVRQAALTPAIQKHCRKVYWAADVG